MTVSNGHSLTALSSVKFTQCSGSFKGEVNLQIYPLVFPYIFLLFFILVHCHFSMHWYFLIYSYYLTVLNGCSLTTLSSVKFTQCSGSFGAVNLKIYPGKSENELLVLNTLVFPYIFLLFDCFKWALIDRIVKCKVHSVLWQFQVGGNLKIYPGKSENELLVLNTLVFPYIFLLFDCFEWVLIDHIVKCKVHSVVWQFWGGG